MIQQLKITFFNYLFKANSKGDAPIYCRIAIGDKKLQFSTGIYINPAIWDKSSQRASGTQDASMLINCKLQEINSKFVRIEKQLCDEGGTTSLQSIYDRYKGKTHEHTLCSVFDERLSKMDSLKGKEYTDGTIQKFREVYAHLKTYLRDVHNSDDINLGHINYGFIKHYQEYLVQKNLKAITINKIIQRFRQMVVFAFRCGYIKTDPFAEYRPLKERKHLVFLTQDELAKLEQFIFVQERLEDVKNIYLFSVYTGLPYHESQSIKFKNIIKGVDGNNWINITRLKTDKELSIPLLPQAEEIIKKLNTYNDNDGFIMPRISNQKINSYLKEISEIVGIHKKLTHHTARKTFATTILLYNDVPIEIVSALLGHSDITVTQRSYAQVVNKNISNHMERLQNRLVSSN